MVRRGILGTALVVVIAVMTTTGSGPVRSLARFTDSASVTGNRFVAAPDWTPPTVTAFTAALASDTKTSGAIRRGSGFNVYVNLDDTGAPASGVVGASVDLSAVVTGATAVPLVAGTYSAPGGGTYAYRSSVQVSDAALPAGTYDAVVRSVDQAGNVGTTIQTLVVSTTYVLMGTTNHVTGSCPTASGGQSDMELAHVATGPERSRTGPGPRDVIAFCSDSLTAGSAIPAGTTEVSLTFQNTLAKSCTVTTTLWRGTTSLGAASRSIGANTSRTTGTWTFSTSAATFAAGDRLSLTVEYQAGNLCNGSTIWWDSAAAPSKVRVP